MLSPFKGFSNEIVIKSKELNKLLKLFEESFNGHSKTTVPKLVLISGDFGSGKTTFTLRAIREFIQKDSSTLAFEITSGTAIKKGYLAKLIEESNADQFIFYCDNIETDSIFKRFNEIRVDLATEQYSDKSIIFVSSIRENILEKLKNHRNNAAEELDSQVLQLMSNHAVWQNSCLQL